MAARQAKFFDTHSEPVEDRVATALHKLGLAMKHEAWALANSEGLSPTQGQILSILSMRGARNGSELANELGVTLPTVSDSVRALVDKGLVAKSPDPRHGRASLVALTSAGRARAAKTRSWPEFMAAAVTALSDTERQVLLVALIKMVRTLQENGQIPTSCMCVTCKHFRPHVHEGPRPHHCAFVDAPMAASHLRVECPDHEAASAGERAAIWREVERDL